MSERIRRFRIACCATVCLLLSGFFAVPRGLSEEPSFRCVWTNEPITVDGLLNESAWEDAEVIDEFRIPATDGQGVPRTTTKARLLWDRGSLYFSAEMEDRDLFADVLEHDGKTWSNDVFELFFKPRRENPAYYEFQVNAAGTVMDLFLPDRESGGYAELKSKESFCVISKVRVDGTLDDRNDEDRGWTVEGRIPWVDFLRTGGRPKVGDVWNLALCRYDYTAQDDPELSSSAALRKANFHRVEDYSGIRFVGPAGLTPAPSHTLETNVTGSPDPPPPYVASRVWPKLNLTFPVFVIPEPGSRRFILIDQERSYGPSRVKRISDPEAGGVEMLIDPKGVAYSAAFHPRFAENGLMYLGSNGRTGDDPHKSRIVRYQFSREAPFGLTGKPKTIIDWESNGHNGAAITFGNDGMMYVTSGDGSSDSDANDAGQDLSKLTAKVLRIDVDNVADGQVADGQAYSVPRDNPFLGNDEARPETWAYGLRNPWRITTDERTGQIWVGNNGQDMWEQAYLIERGANYGWSVYEGSHPFYLNRKLGPTPFTKPTVEHPHSEARSLTGGIVYYGSQLPALRGAYVYGDYATGKIWAVRHDGDKILWHREIADTTLQVVAITADHDGEILIVDHRGNREGGLYRLKKNELKDSRSGFPRRLSETGLFESVSGYKTRDELIPYSVNAPLWSDGAEKKRHIALPPGGSIGFTKPWAWDFPEKTVLVKSFSLPDANGDPRWVETRLMAKEQGEWVGYSYAWNQEQTDAVLVGAEGADRVFEVSSNGSKQRAQRWHYPSRAECMVCHTRAANYVLGLTTLQMNKVHDVDGVAENQLTRLERLGVMRTDWVGDAKAQLRHELEQTDIEPEHLDAYLQQLSKLRAKGESSRSSLLGKPPTDFDHLVDPYDDSKDIHLRARSYLHANCAYCHVKEGGGNAKIDLAFRTSDEKMNVFDVPPLHHHFGLNDAQIIASGVPERSTLLTRLSTRGAGQMPQLGTVLPDSRAIALLTEWISQRSSSKDPADQTGSSQQ